MLVDGIVREPDLGLKSQFTGILQGLLDPEGMDKANVKEQMLGLWYEHCMARLVEPLAAPMDEQVRNDRVAWTVSLCVCVRCF